MSIREGQLSVGSISKSFVVAIVAMVFASIETKADCNPRDFVVQDVKNIQLTPEIELAFVLTATEHEFNKAKQGGATSGGYGLIWGAANYQEAQEKARRIAEATKFNSAGAYAFSYLSQTLSSSALNSYESCLESDRDKPGLTVWLNSKQGDYFTFKAFWVGMNAEVPVARNATERVDGGRIVAKPNVWVRGKIEEIVVKRNVNDDILLELTVDGEVRSYVLVKDPPPVIWKSRPVISERLMRAGTRGANPGCSAGQANDCIYPRQPGGSFVPGSAGIIERLTSDPSKYNEQFSMNTPAQICVTITQSTGACETTQSAQGRLTAIERFPEATE
jgi:hypothetical protein